MFVKFVATCRVCSRHPMLAKCRETINYPRVCGALVRGSHRRLALPSCVRHPTPRPQHFSGGSSTLRPQCGELTLPRRHGFHRTRHTGRKCHSVKHLFPDAGPHRCSRTLQPQCTAHQSHHTIAPYKKRHTCTMVCTLGKNGKPLCDPQPRHQANLHAPPAPRTTATTNNRPTPEQSACYH